jgi:hypothetical protein
MPRAQKYEGNQRAMDVYLTQFGEGLKIGWQASNTDFDSAYDVQYQAIYKSDPLLVSAALDGVEDGKMAGFKARTEYAREHYHQKGQ